MKTEKQWCEIFDNSVELGISSLGKFVKQIQGDALETAQLEVARIAHEQSSGRAVMLLTDVCVAINKISSLTTKPAMRDLWRTTANRSRNAHWLR